jgi:hypothetical protein
MKRFIVPRRWNKSAWRSAIRLKLDEKLKPEETVKSVYITESMKCIVTTETPIMHDNPYGRIEFQHETHSLEFQVVPRKCSEVMEG